MAEQQEPQDRQTLIEHAGQVVSLLSEPRAFLLFLLAVLALFEWSNYHKTERMVVVIQTIIEGVEMNRNREVAGQQQLVSDLIDILEYRTNANNGGRPSAPSPAPPPPSPAPKEPATRE